MASPVIIGSRKSELALVQSRFVQAELQRVHPATHFTISTEATSGDADIRTHLAEMAAASPGLFTKELEVGLLARTAPTALSTPASLTDANADAHAQAADMSSGAGYDLVVHSLKDMPTTLPAGLTLACVCEREDPRDCVLLASRHRSRGVESLAALPAGAVVGTSSLRREALLRRSYPHLTVTPIRGNLNTRLRKLDEGGDAAGEPVYDALVLALAGVSRLSWAARVSEILSPDEFPYPVGQGALGIECRAGDAATLALLRPLVHIRSTLICAAERACLRALAGGCQVPIGVHSVLHAASTARRRDGTASDHSDTHAVTHTLSCTVLAPDASACVDASASIVVALPARSHGVSEAEWVQLLEHGEALGQAVASKLLAAGAADILGPRGPEHARPLTYGAAETPLDR